MKAMRLLLIMSICLLFSAAVVRSQDAGDPKQIYDNAEKMFSLMKYDIAIKEYLKVICLSGDNPYKDKAQYNVGLSLIMTSNPYAAMSQFNKLIDKYPGSPLVAEAKKKLAEVRDIISSQEPTSSYGSTYSPQVLTMEEKVANLFVGWGSDFAGRSKYWSSESNSWVYNSEELKKADYWYSKVIADYPKTHLAAQAQLLKGDLCLNKTGQPDYAGAIAEYQKVVDNYGDKFIWPDEALKKIGDIYRENLSDSDKATAAYKKLIERDGNNMKSYYVQYATARLQYLGGK